MGKTSRLLFGLLAFLMGASAFAQACTEYQATATYNGTEATRVTTEWLPTQQDVCNSLANLLDNYDFSAPWTGIFHGSCAMKRANNTNLGNYGTFSSRACALPDPNICGVQAGTVIKQNVTNGWARTGVPDALDHVGKLFSPYDNGIPAYCLNKCAAKATNQTAAYRSAEPSPNGLHRLSVDYEFTVQGTAGQPGTTCTAATNPQAFTDALSPNTQPMACAGVVGTVNGKKVCAPDGSTNTIPAPQGEPIPGTEASGNPRAGDVPTTGEGSGTGGAGRTPAVGNGTATGGPTAAAGSGTAPSGNVTSPAEGEEQAECGAPGQPACRIDETGTPSTKDFGPETSQLESAKTDVITEIGKTRTGTGFTWTFALPSGCQPLVLSAFSDVMSSGLTLDVCEWQPMIHDLMSMIWIAATIFALWGMASRAFAPE